MYEILMGILMGILMATDFGMLMHVRNTYGNIHGNTYGHDECGNSPTNIIHGWVKSNPADVLDTFGKYVSPIP